MLVVVAVVVQVVALVTGLAIRDIKKKFFSIQLIVYRGVW